jgi:hypothetical protein
MEDDDKFSKMWRRQLAFTALLLSTIDKPLDELTEDDRIRLTKDYVAAIHSEADEVLNNVPWKQHRFIGAANREALLEELVDLLKFTWGLMDVWAVTPAELERAFNRKSSVVEQRFRQDHLLPKQVANDRVVIIDIDGVVADWSNGFMRWVSKNRTDLVPSDYDKAHDPGLREVLKSNLHSSGGMLELDPIPGAKAAIEDLRKAGYVVVWLSARPVSRYPRLAGDTVEWLKRHGFPTDYIYFSDLNKHVFVVERLPMAAAIFDDEPEIVSHAKDFGLKASLVTLIKDLPACVKEFLEEEEQDG